MPLWRVSDLLPWHSLIAAQTRRKRGLGDQLRKNQLGLVFWAIPAEESGRKRKKAEESGRKRKKIPPPTRQGVDRKNAHSGHGFLPCVGGG